MTLEEKVDDAIKRLGRIEKDLIDIRDHLLRDPTKPRYLIDPNAF